MFLKVIHPRQFQLVNICNITRKKKFTTPGMQMVMTNSNHMGFPYIVAQMDSREMFYGLKEPQTISIY